eukprot:scaffold265116_cov21-Tisochrysis_lutea.AAC.2
MPNNVQVLAFPDCYASLFLRNTHSHRRLETKSRISLRSPPLLPALLPLPFLGANAASLVTTVSVQKTARHGHLLSFAPRFYSSREARTERRCCTRTLTHPWCMYSRTGFDPLHLSEEPEMRKW